MAQLWQQFETRILNDLRARGDFASRIPTGCRIIRAGKPPKVQLIRTDFDYAAGVLGRAVFFDAKATEKKSFNFKSYVTSKKSQHQFRAMYDAYDRGSYAGYLIWFYDVRKIAWVPVEKVFAYLKEGSKSVGPDTPGIRSIDDWEPIDLATLIGIKDPN